MAKSIVLKDVQSPERLLDETALFLHRVVADLPEAKRQMLERLHGSNEVLRGRKVLVVDDDARNIFALTTVLENQEMEVLSATNGRQAIELIQNTPDLSVVLMDIMMPEMDGYETMREIRKDPQFRTLPILALTAKAMKGDREKCLRGRRVRLHRQAGQHRPAALAAARLAVSLDSMADDRSNILLVDDEPRNLDVLEAILGDPDVPPASRATIADEALLLLLEQRRSRRIVLDIKMPGRERHRAGAVDQEHEAVPADRRSCS